MARFTKTNIETGFSGHVLRTSSKDKQTNGPILCKAFSLHSARQQGLMSFTNKVAAWVDRPGKRHQIAAKLFHSKLEINRGSGNGAGRVVWTSQQTEQELPLRYGRKP